VYVVVLKNRMYENKFIREQHALFDHRLTPLIEVLSTKIGRKDHDLVDWLDHYDRAIDSMFFVDFFTFDDAEYKKFDPKQVPFYLEHRSDTIRDYTSMLSLVSQTDHGIPVLSLKRARSFLLHKHTLVNAISVLQKKTSKLAIRIEAPLFESYFRDIDMIMRNEDILIYDINEEAIESKYFDLEIIGSRKTRYPIIVLHSPRSATIKNGLYPDGTHTDLIDNTLRETYQDYGFSGFADYAGLKNVLPTDGGNGKGAALGLFFDHVENSFFSIVNTDITQGVKGHEYVIKRAFEDFRDLLDPNHHCPAFTYMSDHLLSQGKTGSWGQWKYITILRYLSQIKTARHT